MAVVVNMSSKNLFNEYQSTTKTDVKNTKAARTNDREAQNTRTLYKALQKYITEDIKT